METLSKKLNRDNVERQMGNLGFSSSELAKRLDVSKQTISNWINGKKFPRPAKLLRLAQLLGLKFPDMVIKLDLSHEPAIAFRRKGNHKITTEYYEAAKNKGYLLEKLVSYLPYDNQSTPPILIKPSTSYQYIQEVASKVRREITKNIDDVVEFKDLIKFFNKYHAVIIPVFWGSKKNHENALHVFLPDSMTTWIYLNLDSKIHDFKFWMAHELGHVKAPSLVGDEGEDFADSFAGALLVNQELAEKEYIHLRRLSNEASQLNRIKEVAENLVISPLTIYYEINKYADFTKKSRIDLEGNRQIFKVNTAFCSKYNLVSETLFKHSPTHPKEYFESAKIFFDSPFFESLRDFLKKEKKSVGFLQEVLNLSPVDAHAFYEEIC